MGRLKSRITTVAIIALAGLAHASVPTTLSEQGRLFNADGTAATGTVSMQFSIYDAATGGTQMWTETQTVTLDSGYFSVQLGSATMFPSTLWNGASRFIGLQVGSDAEMTPREEVTSTAYALVSGDAIGDIHPTSVYVGGQQVIDPSGRWIGPGGGGSGGGGGGGGGTTASTPAGTIVAYGGTSPPSGWLLCDGRAVNRTTYPALFAAIGSNWGAGDGATTFNLPDLRGRFLRGQNAGTGRDPDAGSRTASASGGNGGDNVGSVQVSDFPSHTHGVNDPGHSHTDAGHTHSFDASHTHTYSTLPPPAGPTGTAAPCNGSNQATYGLGAPQYCLQTSVMDSAPGIRTTGTGAASISTSKTGITIAANPAQGGGSVRHRVQTGQRQRELDY